MCIIAAKPAGIDMPKREYIENMFRYNHDGAGLMWAQNGKVHIEKGFMDLNAFLARLDVLDKTVGFKNRSVVMHFRITTHGGTKPENCHPFPVSDSKGMLRKLKCTTDVGVAHNGIITIDCLKDMSDTMTYVATQLAPLKRAVPKFYKNKDLLQMIENAIDSKMAILDGKGCLTLIGDFQENNGIKYSNGTWNDYEFPRSFMWNTWDNWSNPDKWEIGSGMTNYTHKIVMWLDEDEGQYAIGPDGEEYYEAAVDEDGLVYIYDETVGAIRFILGAEAWDYEGRPVFYDPKGFVTDELVAEEY